MRGLAVTGHQPPVSKPEIWKGRVYIVDHNVKEIREVIENLLETLLLEISSKSTHRCFESLVGVKGEEFAAHDQHGAGHIGHFNPLAGWILDLERDREAEVTLCCKGICIGLSLSNSHRHREYLNLNRPFIFEYYLKWLCYGFDN